jgi:ATP-dependent RNA helicase RhlE
MNQDTPVITFASLNLAAPILRALVEKAYTHPSPIQAQAIPALLEGRDLIGCAQTGSGKTAAFALPILQRLAARPLPPTSRRPRALILTPTRELAAQIGENIALYGRHLTLRHTVIFGGVGEHPQIKALTAGVDIVVATPGRLLDLMERGYVALDRVEIFVLDEADRMLDMGFAPDVKRIIARLPPRRQSLLFSATMPEEIRDMANRLLRDPVRVDVAPAATTVESVEQRVCHVQRSDKHRLLVHTLQKHPKELVLVFSRTKHGANRIADNLERDGIQAAAIHGNKSQGARQRALEDFRAGRTRVLVATDIAARGIDVKGIALVVNFDIPEEPEAYVHRIGRTARMGAKGLAFSFCDPSENSSWRDILRLIRQTVPVYADHPFAASAARAMPAETPRPMTPPQDQPRRFGGGFWRTNRSPRQSHGSFQGRSLLGHRN